MGFNSILKSFTYTKIIQTSKWKRHLCKKNVEDVEDDKSENNSNNTEGKGLSGRDYKAKKFKTIFFYSGHIL